MLFIKVIAYREFFISHLLGLVCGSLMAVSVAQSDLDRIHSPPADQRGSICLIHPLQHLQEEEEEDAVRTQEWLLVFLHLDCFEDSPFISGPGI